MTAAAEPRADDQVVPEPVPMSTPTPTRSTPTRSTPTLSTSGRWTPQRATRAPRPFRTPVRGHPYAGRPDEVAAPSPGQGARLVREPGNPADPLAVAVWVEDADERWRIGYLDRGVAARLAPRIDRGQRLAARIDGWVSEPDGRWRRPMLLVLPEGGEPETPASRPALWGRPPGVVRRPVS